MDILGQIDARVVIGAIGGCYTTLLLVVFWVGRTKVNHKLFDVAQKNNNQEHENIRNWIKDAEERAETRHSELKDDLREVKRLIQKIGE